MMSFIKTSNMDKYCYRKGDIVKLSNECLKSIGRNVSSDDVDVKIPIRDILPVKINSIEDRDIYYDPVVAASVIGAGQETPTSKKDKGEYYLNALRRSFNSEQHMKMIEYNHFICHDIL